MKRITSGGRDDRPVSYYYQYKKPEKAHPKVKVLEKGMTFKGKYLFTFVDEEMGFKSHLIENGDEGKVVIKGATQLNNAFAEIPKQTYCELTYEGKGKAQKGKRAPYLWTVDADIKETAAAEFDESKASDSDAEVEEELSEEVPF